MQNLNANCIYKQDGNMPVECAEQTFPMPDNMVKWPVKMINQMSTIRFKKKKTN